ncbi:MAG TPA: cobaltochelatase subunit CobN [Hyphomicrobiales bacterium]|nr:cobaltochelatase subunit CobN [Hyphomicrobiales bacterium]
MKPLRALLHALPALAALLLSALPAAAQQVTPPPQPVTLSYLFSDGNLSGTFEAYRTLLAQHPELEGLVNLEFLTESLYDQANVEAIRNSDVLVLDMMNQGMLDRFNTAHDTNLISDITPQGTVLAVGVGLQPTEYFTEQGAVWDEQAQAYWQNGGRENQLALMELALGRAGIAGFQLPAPQISLDFGYYYSGGDGGQVFADWDTFQSWRQQNGHWREGAPEVAIGFYRANYYDSDTAVIDAMIDAIEAQGANAVPFFGYPDGVAFERLLLDENGRARANVALALLMRFADFSVTEQLAKLNIPVINAVTLYGRDEQDWLASNSGLSLFEGTFQVAVPEVAGLVAPTVVGSRERVRDNTTGLSIAVNSPISERVTMAVRRALRYARLQSKPNADKHLAFLYYNYPVGKANIGASYLNIAESLSNILNDLKARGYDVGEGDLSSDAILADMTEKARNVGSYAPGELEAMVAQDSVEEIPIATYRQWLDALAPALRDKILADWGDPAAEKLMSAPCSGESGDGNCFIVPRLQYGKIILMPQPARGWGEDLEKLYHAEDLAPHHQYVAAYQWLSKVKDIDAVIHMGTHGTLEWLDGKDTGLSEADAPDALISDIPNLYVYNVDVVGEGLVARRRSMATLIDHMVPSFVAGGLYPELAALGENINDYDINIEKNPELAEAFAGPLVQRVIDLGIDKALNLQLEGKTFIPHEQVHQIQDYVVTLKEQYIPYGLHALGRLPDLEMRRSTVDAIVSTDRRLLPDERKVLAEDMEQRIIDSASAELNSLASGLEGGYIMGSSGGEPIRNPDAYPTGRNFYGIDPEKVPKKAAWELGRKLADDMLAKHLAEHGAYPQKVSFVIWGDETMRHEGVVESQIFWLLGTRPVWNDRDKVVDVEVIPTSQLGRPRVDIVIASAAEGMFNNVTNLMDQAVQKVKAIEEADNYVRDHYLATKATLIGMGYSEEDADRRAGVRIFDEPPGVYNLNTSNIAAASGTWDDNVGLANDYINKMGHGFGNGFWGEPMQDVFKLALSGVEKVVHSSSTTLYGALDNDDFYMYMGGLASAVRTVSGQQPELVVTNTRDPGKPAMDSLDKFIGSEFQTRYINPEWIKGMQAEGYAGARTMVEFVEYLWGWDATVDNLIDDRMWQDTFEVYVQDRYDLDMKAYFDENSPYAFQDMSARMLETIRKEHWDADEATRKELLEAYLGSVQEHGLSCSDITCGNPRLMEYMVEEGQALGVDGVALAAFQAALQAALRADVSQLADAARDFARQNDARIQAMYQPATAQAPELEGFKMERMDNNAAPSSATATLSDRKESLFLQGLVLVALLMWWWRRRLRQRLASAE